METGNLLSPGAAGASVRPATVLDAAAMAAVQARCWHRAWPDLLRAGVLNPLDPAELTARWAATLASLPSPRHAVLVACSGSTVVGLAALAPSGDGDADAGDGELVTLEVDPAHQRAGHGSRLLAAAARAAQARRFTALRAWCPEADQARREFLGSAGLRPDGARRQLRSAGGAVLAEERLAATLAS